MAGKEERDQLNWAYTAGCENYLGFHRLLLNLVSPFRRHSKMCSSGRMQGIAVNKGTLAAVPHPDNTSVSVDGLPSSFHVPLQCSAASWDIFVTALQQLSVQSTHDDAMRTP